jgi:hypothetical protein
MNKNLRRKVLENIFLGPAFVFPFVVGVVAFILSFEEGARSVRFIGLGALTISCAYLVAKLTVLFNGTVNKTYADIQKLSEKDRERALDDFEKEIVAFVCESRWPRTRQQWWYNRNEMLALLKAIRNTYKLFVAAVANNRIGQYDLLDTAEKLFKVSVYNLEQSFEIFSCINSDSPIELREKACIEQERLLQQVREGVRNLVVAIEEVQKIKNNSGLSVVCSEMREKLDAMKKSEQENKELDNLRFTPFQYEKSRI